MRARRAKYPERTCAACCALFLPWLAPEVLEIGPPREVPGKGGITSRAEQARHGLENGYSKIADHDHCHGKIMPRNGKDGEKIKKLYGERPCV